MSRIASPQRPRTRIAFEVVEVVAWPLLLVGLLLLPLAPAACVVAADLERSRARRCGEDATPYRRTAGSWSAWLGHRLRSRGWWRHDVPVAVASLVVGAFAGLGLLFGLTGGTVLLAAPAFHAWGPDVTLAGWEGNTWASSAAMSVLGLSVLAATVGIALAASLLRDAVLRGLGGDETDRLERELGAVRTSRADILTAFEAERRRIERDLHDGAQQDLVALSITLGMLEHVVTDLPGEGAERVRDLARRAHDQADRSLVRLRETVHGIHPRELTDHGLLAAVRELGDRSPIRVTHHADGQDAAIPSPVAGAVYFVVAEALTNVVRHAGVDRAEVRLDVGANEVRVVVADDGRGGAHLRPGSGLAGLRERMRALGGDLVVDSPTGRGTTVRAWAPTPVNQSGEGKMTP